jgi:hypothetical protein
MMRATTARRMTPLVLALTLVAHCAHAGTRPQTGRTDPMSFRVLADGTPEAAAIKDQVRQLRIRWTLTPAPPPGGNRPAAVPSAVPALSVISEQSIAGSIRRQRQPQVTTDQLVVVQKRADGRALDWALIANPRLVRAEVPGADGRLTGRTVLRDDVELMVIMTPAPDAVTVALYQPRWTGTEHVLDLIGEATLPRIR